MDRKLGGGTQGELGPRLEKYGLGRGIADTTWHLVPSSRLAQYMAEKWGAAPPLWEMGPDLT